ncbi:MAG: emp24/gp25L/p24 family protein [Candidatus Bathyarchaeia archaeon]
MSKPIFVLIVFFLLLGSLAVFVHASQTFTVPPLSEQTVKVNLNQGDFVKGTVSVSGGTGTGVDFMVSDPNGKELLSYNYTSYKSFSFSASITGTYTLSFDNSFCSCIGGKNVTLEYSVNDKPVQGSLEVGSNGGFPIVIILILVIVIVAIAAVVTLMRRLRTNTNNATLSP